MHNNYVEEPATTGKVILKTSHGEIDIELWTKECPKTCRNFIELCMEGYYDGTIFHRLIPGFMIQGGDPTGTGRGGESIYGKHFADEVHNRLRFEQRGRVAMANEEQPNTNGSQFFITFDACTWLDKKHTIFGKVVGDTIYNVLNLQSLDTDSEDRPINAPKILSAQVIINPFDDIAVRNKKVATKEDLEDDSSSDEQAKVEELAAKNIAVQKIEKEKVKNKKNEFLLSFDEDEEEDEDEVEKNEDEEEQVPEAKIKPIHDLVNDTKLSKEYAIAPEELEKRRREREEEEEKRNHLKDRLKNPERDGVAGVSKKIKIEGEEEARRKVAAENEENKELLEKYKTRKNKKTGEAEIYFDSDGDEEEGREGGRSSDESYSSTDSEEYENEHEKKLREKQKQEYENLKIEFLNFKEDKLGSNNQDVIGLLKENKKLLSNLEKRKMRFLESETVKAAEEDKLGRLEKFRGILNSEKVRNDRTNWLAHKLKFHIDSANAFKNVETKEKVTEFKRIDDEFIMIDTRDELKNKMEDREQTQIRLKDIISVDELMKMGADKE